MRLGLIFGFLLFPMLINGQVPGYKHRIISGFNIYIAEEAWKDHESVTLQAIDLLSAQLDTILGFGLKHEIIDSLQQIKLFMDWNNAYSAAVYHPSRQWLIENGHEPQKAQSVEISNIRHFIDWSALNQPFMILHELAHAYHHRVLGFDYEPIIGAYEGAMAGSLYDAVSLHTGNGEYTVQEAYAKRNKLEYFAELTEAYLGENDFYPFVKEEFRDHDIEGYRVVSGIWQFEATIDKSGKQ